MPDKAQAIHDFWSGFGIPAIDEQSAYDTPIIEELAITHPYITYEVQTDSFDSPVAIGADLWDKATTWSRVTQIADLISSTIGRGGKIVMCDEGALWITRGSPFTQRMDAENDADVRRLHININTEFLTP